MYNIKAKLFDKLKMKRVADTLTSIQNERARRNFSHQFNYALERKWFYHSKTDTFDLTRQNIKNKLYIVSIISIQSSLHLLLWRLTRCGFPNLLQDLIDFGYSQEFLDAIACSITCHNLSRRDLTGNYYHYCELLPPLRCSVLHFARPAPTLLPWICVLPVVRR